MKQLYFFLGVVFGSVVAALYGAYRMEAPTALPQPVELPFVVLLDPSSGCEYLRWGGHYFAPRLNAKGQPKCKETP